MNNKTTVCIPAVTVTNFSGTPFANIKVHVSTNVKVFNKVQEVAEDVYLKDCIVKQYMNPEIVKAFWDEVERVVKEQVGESDV